MDRRRWQMCKINLFCHRKPIYFAVSSKWPSVRYETATNFNIYKVAKVFIGVLRYIFVVTYCWLLILLRWYFLLIPSFATNHPILGKLILRNVNFTKFRVEEHFIVVLYVCEYLYVCLYYCVALKIQYGNSETQTKKIRWR